MSTHGRALDPDTLPARPRAQGAAPGSAPDAPTLPEPTSSPTASGERPIRARAALSAAPLSTSATVAAATAATGVETGPHTARTVESLHLQEVGMSQRYVRIALGFAAFGLSLVPWIGGHPLAKAAYVSGMLAIAGASLWLGWRMRDPAGYTIERSTKSAMANLYGAFALVYFFGVFSSASMVLPFGIYFFTLKQNDRATRAFFVVSTVVYGLLAVGVIAGALPDVGLLSSDRMSSSDRIVLALVAETTMVVTFVIARATRANVRRAVEHQDRLVRDLARRETMLAEARAELEQALETGRFGRFTDVVFGAFRLGTVLGRGGMGEVYEATHATTGAPAAVKVLHARALGRPEAVRAFLREIRSLAELRSANVVRVLEVGGPEAEFPYVAMERLRGRTLAELLRQQRRLPPAAVVALVEQVAAGLEALRAAGLVHRDVKPGNLFLAEGDDGLPVWKILDLGVVRALASPEHEARLVGTPGYMAPEQATRGPVCHRTDVFALALVAYRALTGQAAFGAGTPELLEHGALPDVVPPSRLVPVSPAVDDVLGAALSADPDARPHALELAVRFARAVSSA